MRLLFFNEAATAVGGGRNQYVLDVCKRLRERGHEVGLVHGRTPKPTFRGTGYVFDHLGAEAGESRGVHDRLQAILDDFRPDVVQLHGVGNVALHRQMNAHAPTARFIHNHEFYCSGCEMTWGLPRKICERPHGPGCLRNHYLRQCGSWNPLANLARYRRVSVLLQSLEHLDGIQVASHVIRENLERNGVEAGRIEWIPLYAPVPAVPRRSSLKMARRMVLHPGGMVRNKGVWLLLNAARRLPEDVELVFAGGGDQQERVENHVRANKLGERVRIMGELDAAAWSELYHQAHVVVFPSRWNEPLGLCGIQAMAHGKPVVAFDAGGVGGWLRDRTTGVAVAFNDRRQFVEELVALLGRPRRIADMGANALKAWEENFRPRHHILHLEEYYRKLAAARAGKPE